MSHGGRRPGAGRPKGSTKLGKLASPDLRQMARVWSTEVLGSWKDPLGLLISIAADEKHPLATRMNAATIAVPYLYPKLSAATVETHATVTRVDGRDLIDQLEARLARSAPLLEAATDDPADADDNQAAT